jgi:acyl carrier protein
MREIVNSGKDNRSTFKTYLKNDLENLEGAEVPREDLKEMVFDTLDTLEMIGDVADLFTVKFIKSETDLFNTIGSSSKKNKTKPKN